MSFFKMIFLHTYLNDIEFFTRPEPQMILKHFTISINLIRQISVKHHKCFVQLLLYILWCDHLGKRSKNNLSLDPLSASSKQTSPIYKQQRVLLNAINSNSLNPKSAIHVLFQISIPTYNQLLKLVVIGANIISYYRI